MSTLKKSALIIVGCAIVFIAIGFIATNQVIKQKQTTKQINIYKNLITIIDTFHTEIKTLSPSVTGKTQLQEELRKMKIFAQGSREKIRHLAVEGNSAGSLPLIEMIEKTDKYISEFEQLANLSTTSETLKARSETMLLALKEFKSNTETFGSPDKGDTTETIDRATKLSRKFDSSRKSVGLSSGSIKSPSERVIVVGNYWSNPEYSDYRQQIFQIVAEYSSGRTNLTRVLSHYDKQMFSDIDRAQWNIELNKRRVLLSRINSLSSQIPPYSIYKEHHSLLKQMLENAIGAMENFANNENSSNRIYLSQISSRNSAIMNRLKRFYGIR